MTDDEYHILLRHWNCKIERVHSSIVWYSNLYSRAVDVNVYTLTLDITHQHHYDFATATITCIRYRGLAATITAWVIPTATHIKVLQKNGDPILLMYSVENELTKHKFHTNYVHTFKIYIYPIPYIYIFFSFTAHCIRAVQCTMYMQWAYRIRHTYIFKF